MCSAVPCQVCGGITWRGCGKHIDAVKSQVPPEAWCDGRHDELRMTPAALQEQQQSAAS